MSKLSGISYCVNEQNGSRTQVPDLLLMYMQMRQRLNHMKCISAYRQKNKTMKATKFIATKLQTV